MSGDSCPHILLMHRHSQDGDGSFCHIYPIPTPTLPLKGREFVITELKLVPLISESNGTNLSAKIPDAARINTHSTASEKREEFVPSPSRGRPGWGWVLLPHLPHPHPNPPLEREGVCHYRT